MALGFSMKIPRDIDHATTPNPRPLCHSYLYSGHFQSCRSCDFCFGRSRPAPHAEGCRTLLRADPNHGGLDCERWDPAILSLVQPRSSRWWR